MAYDNEGRYYFDPQLDVADKQALEDTARLEQAMLFKQGQRQQQAAGKFQADAWNEVLKEAGLDQESYAKLHGQDPEGTKELIKESMRLIVKGVSNRKGKPQPKYNTETGQLTSEQPAQVTNEKANEKLEAARGIINKRALTNDEELSVLEAVLGGNL